MESTHQNLKLSLYDTVSSVVGIFFVGIVISLKKSVKSNDTGGTVPHWRASSKKSKWHVTHICCNSFAIGLWYHTTGYKLTSRTISARISLWLEYFMSVNCYMVHLLKGFIGSNGYDQSWKGFPRKSPISANITHVLWLLSWLPQPFPLPDICAVNHHDLTRVLIEF